MHEVSVSGYFTSEKNYSTRTVRIDQVETERNSFLLSDRLDIIVEVSFYRQSF
jgi:hypothetical protein